MLQQPQPSISTELHAPWICYDTVLFIEQTLVSYRNSGNGGRPGLFRPVSFPTVPFGSDDPGTRGWSALPRGTKGLPQPLLNYSTTLLAFLDTNPLGFEAQLTQYSFV